MWYTHTMECYSAFKRKGVLIHATAWMKLEDILFKISHIRKDKHVLFHLHKVARVVKFRCAESTTVVVRGWREGKISYCLMDRVSVQEVRKVLETGGSDECMRK